MTKRVIRQLCDQDSHVIGISHSRNFGSQSAFLSGMEIATGDAVILLDGDLQDPPAMIEAFYRQWKQGYEVVYGIRIKRQASWYMQMFYKAFYRVFKHLSEVEIPLDAGDFSLIDRKAVEHLLRFRERDLFVRGLRAWIGFKQTGVPYMRPERMFGRSTNKFLKNVWWAKKGIFSFSLKPLYYIQGFGLLIFAVSIALALFYLFYYLLNPSVTGARHHDNRIAHTGLERCSASLAQHSRRLPWQSARGGQGPSSIHPFENNQGRRHNQL